MDVLFLDTETTGIPAYGQEALHVAIVHLDGRVLLDTYVRPVRHQEWPGAQEIHGITPEQVLRPEVPTMDEVAPRIADIVRGQKLVIYNRAYDEVILAEALALGPPAEIVCLMLAFSEHYGEWHEYFQNYRWQPLRTAADYVLHEWSGKAHTALHDTLAARAVYLYLTDTDVRQRIDAERARRDAIATEEAIVHNFLYGQNYQEQRRLQAVNDAWTLAYFPELQYAGLYFHNHPLPRPFLSAAASAEAFSVHLTGFGLQMWGLYRDRLLLPRYGKGHAPVPEHLVPGCNVARGVHFLAGGRDRLPAAMLVTRQHQLRPGDLVPELSLLPLYDVSRLVEGVDYVPYVRQQPEGYYTKTELKKQLRLSEAQIRQLQPGRVWRTRYGVDCFLYPAAQVAALSTAA